MLPRKLDRLLVEALAAQPTASIWGRDCPDLPCEVVFDPEAWQAAWLVAKRCRPLEAPPPLGDRVRLMAGFGGFLGRQGDGHPSPKALWTGLQRVQEFAIGIAAAKEVFIPTD